MEEIWKDIPGYEGIYRISNIGRVFSIKRNGTIGKILTFKENRGGYLFVTLSKNNIQKPFTIHKLVALSFLTKPDFYECINHIDGNKKNNTPNNLEYTTILLNNQHAIKIGLCKDKAKKLSAFRTGKNGILNGKSMPVIQYDRNTGKAIKEHISATFAHQETGINRQNISQCCVGTRKSAGGYFWKHKNKK